MKTSVSPSDVLIQRGQNEALYSIARSISQTCFSDDRMLATCEELTRVLESSCSPTDKLFAKYLSESLAVQAELASHE